MTRTETDIAWCAGFFDGEGHVSYRRQTNPETLHVSGSLMCSVPQNADNVEVLEFFQSVIGFGTIRGPYLVKTNGKKNLRFEVGFKVKEILPLFKIIKPYLKSKKTADFEHALMQYCEHDSTATIEDINKMTAKMMKKRKKTMISHSD